MKHATTLVLVAAMTAGTGMAANAASINGTLTSVEGSGPYTWTYDAVLNGESRIEGGDYFFIADFNGYVDGSIFAPTNWTGSVENVSTCPVFQNCSSDSASVSNLVFTYSGGTAINNPTPEASQPLGEFGAQSIYDDEIVGFWSARDTNDGDGSVNGTKSGNSQQINVPVGASVPEPGMLVMLGLGLLGAGVSARRRS